MVVSYSPKIIFQTTMNQAGWDFYFLPSVLRCVKHQPVPLALDVVVLRLLSDIKTIKLKLSGQLLLSLEDD